MSNKTPSDEPGCPCAADAPSAGFEADRIARDDSGVLRPARLDPDDELTVEALHPSGAIRPVQNNPMVIMKMERPPKPAKIVGGGLELPWLLTVSLMTTDSGSLPEDILNGRSHTFWAYVRRLPGDGFGGAVYDVGIAVKEASMQLRPGGAGGGVRRVSPFAAVADRTDKAFERMTLALPESDPEPGGPEPIPCWLWRAQARRFEMGTDEGFRALARYPELDDAILRVYGDSGASAGLSAVPLYRAGDGVLVCAVGTRYPSTSSAPARVFQRSEMELTRLRMPYHLGAPLVARAVELIQAGQLAQLVAERAKVAELSTACNEAAASHRADVEAIGNALIEEADSRSWCDVYDTFVDNVNRGLTVPLPVRIREYDVEVSVQTTVTIHTSAATESEARDNVGSDDVREALRDHSYSMHSDDWDIADVNESD
jgi:hypothetical protein